jgi:hypothetical protein
MHHSALVLVHKYKANSHNTNTSSTHAKANNKHTPTHTRKMHSRGKGWNHEGATTAPPHRRIGPHRSVPEAIPYTGFRGNPA